MTQIEQARRCFQTRDGSSVLAAKPTQIWASIWRDFAPLSTGGAGLGQLRLLVDLPGVRCSRAMEIATTGNSSDGGFFLSMAVAVCLRRRIRLRHVLCLRHLQLQRLLAVAVLMFSGVCATACLTIFFMKDVNFYEGFSRLGCNLFALSITLAFIMWSLQAASSFSGFWLLVSFF